MKAKQGYSMTEGSLTRGILVFSLPLMLSNVLQALFNMSDIAVVGKFAGAEALGSVGSTTILVSLFTGFLIGVGSGVNAVTARYLGAHLHKGVSQTVHTGFLLCLFIGLIEMVLGLIFARPLLELLNTKDELIDGATLYLRIYLLGIPAAAMYNYGNGVLSAAGDTKNPLYILTIAGVVNVALNLFFVIVCKLSVAGVALASVISLYLSAGLILRSLTKSVSSYSLQRRELKISQSKARQLLGLCLPAGAQNSIFAIANLFIQAGVNSFDAVIVEGTAAAANADALVYDVMAALYTACASFMAQNTGAGNKKRVIRSYFISLAFSFLAGAVLGGTLVLFGQEFLSLFTTDAAVAEAGMVRLTVMSYSYAFSAFMDCTIAASRGLGKSVVPTIIVIMGSCVFRVVWVYTIFAYFHTIMSLYLLYICSWTITAIAEIIYFVHVYRHKVFVAPNALEDC